VKTIQTKQWDAREHGLHTEENIRRTFSPPEWFRVSRYTYPLGTSFDGAMRPGVVHVMSGRCRYSFDDVSAIVSAGELAELPGGAYSLQVLGEEELVVILAWRLPFKVPE